MKDKLKNKKINKKNIYIIGIILMISLVVVGLVIAQSQEDLEAELAQLIGEITGSGYDWLVNYTGELPVVEPAEIEVYTENNDTLITKFTDVGDEGWYRVLLTELIGVHDVFDLKIIGFGIEFDYIVDPTIILSEDDVITTSLLTNVTAETGKSNHTHLNISNTAPYDSLVGYWAADGDEEEVKLTTVYDWSKYNNDGIMYDDVTANDTGLYGKGFEFDNDNDFINLTNAIPAMTNATVTAWVNIVDEISCAISGTDGVSNFSMLIFDSLDRFYVGNGINQVYWSYSDGLFDGKWKHISVVTNITHAEIYIDSVSQGPLALGGLGETKYLGRGHDYRFSGTIDEVMIFNRALSENEVKALYNLSLS